MVAVVWLKTRVISVCNSSIAWMMEGGRKELEYLYITYSMRVHACLCVCVCMHLGVCACMQVYHWVTFLTAAALNCSSEHWRQLLLRTSCPDTWGKFLFCFLDFFLFQSVKQTDFCSPSSCSCLPGESTIPLNFPVGEIDLSFTLSMYREGIPCCTSNPFLQQGGRKGQLFITKETAFF